MPAFIANMDNGVQTAAVTAGITSDTPIKTTSGYLGRVLVTATGSAATLIYDNASGHTGTVIGVIKTTAAVGDVVTFGMPAAVGITVAGAATNAGFTVSFY